MYGVGSARSQARIVGLASGLDVDSLVKGMTVSINNRINKQLQARQALQWKIEAYRSVSSVMIDFSNKYLSYASKSNLLSPSFYSSTTITAKGANAGAVSVSGKLTSSGFSITDIISTAKAASFTGGKQVSDHVITTGEIDFTDTGRLINELDGKTLTIEYEGTRHNIKFNISAGNNLDDAAKIALAFNDALSDIDINGTPLSDIIEMTAAAGDISIGYKTNSIAPPTSFSVIGGSAQSILNLDTANAIQSDGTDTVDGTISETNLFTPVYAKSLSGKTIAIDYNGIKKNVTIGEILDNTDASVIAAIQQGIDNAFGANRIKVFEDGGHLSFETVMPNGVTPDSTATLSITGGDAGIFGKYGVFNTELAGLSNRLNSNASLDSIFGSALNTNPAGEVVINVNGNEMTFNKTQSFASVINAINSSNSGLKLEYMSTADVFSVVATETGAHGRVEIDDTTGNLSELLFGVKNVDYTVSGGTDAAIEISYDGGAPILFTRSTNNFNIDGLDITLKPDVEFIAGQKITFESAVNTDEIFKAITEMVDAYNSIMEIVNKQLTTKPDRKYYPLTPEMKADMKDSEVEQWNAAANSGLLFGDLTLRQLASDLRFNFSFPVPGVGSLGDFGITAGNSWMDNGKIKIDEDKLRKAIEERPDDVVKLFTAQKSDDPNATIYDMGIINRVKTVMDKYAGTVGTTKGTLITIAGVKDSVFERDSRLVKQLDDINKLIENLEIKRKEQEDRYYRQFATLEQYISKMAVQSSWFTQQLQ